MARQGVAAAGRPSLRSILFVAVLLVAWVSLHPFGNLAAADALDLTSGNEAATYGLFALFAAVAGALVWQSDRAALRALKTPAFLLLCAWLVISVATSQDVATSAKRFVLLVCVSIACASLLLLPHGRRHLAHLLAAAAAVLLILSYGGVMLVPHLAVHQFGDLAEPDLAGKWRGVFPHKNDASAVFSMLVFVGIYVVRAGYRHAGIAIALASGIFVLCSGGKSSTLICALTIILSFAIQSSQSKTIWLVLIAGPLILLNLLGLGSVLFPEMGWLAASLPLDATFTGRTDVWRFALGHVSDHLAFGHGFAAFWNTASLRFGVEDTTVWAGNASHAHNGYLDAVLSMGLAGLALTLAAFVFAPARDLYLARKRGADRAMTIMTMQIWLFGIYLSSLESFFFDRANAIWITFLFAIFAIRYLAVFKVSER
ncbi:MAG: O-antigen ligase family protein [Methylobacteriaceae bacterium]|nr:O-antigen ligase family protein [Methylobacteriaceae bacterium]